MSQLPITLTANGVTLQLDPDLHWSDEFSFAAVEQSVQRSLTGALIIHTAAKIKGRPITLEPPAKDSAWMPRATLAQLLAWELDPSLTMTLNLRGQAFSAVFRRHDGLPIEASPVEFVANPVPGEFGDWYLTTVRLMEI